jgi:hypothetical protein
MCLFAKMLTAYMDDLSQSRQKLYEEMATMTFASTVHHAGFQTVLEVRT